MADQGERLKTIANNIERMYQALRLAASHISGLLQLGKATCTEVRAYNLWALATYNTQAGMLATLRANGEPGVPELPTSPTLFAWRGVQGQDALQIECENQTSDLGRAMRSALRGPKVTSQFISTNEVQIVTQDQFVFDPASAPSFKTLFQVQQAQVQAQTNGLGAVVAIFIAIAGIAIAVSVAVAAIMRYLETSEIEESKSEQVASQSEAYTEYLKARLDCFKTCAQQDTACVALCQKLVKEPNIILPGQKKPWGWLQWTGFTVVAGVGTMALYKIWQRRAAGKPIFELPD